MASAQVSSNSRKEHFEAGKKRLEEFRKKKAAEKAKKVISTSQLSSSDAGQNEKQSSESVRIGITDYDGAGTSGGLGGILTETSGLATNNNGKAIEPLQKNDINASNDRPADSFVSANDDVWKSAIPLKTTLINDDVLRPARQESVNYTSHGNENYELSNYAKPSESVGYDITSDQSMALHPPATRGIDKNFDLVSYYRLNEETLNDDGSNLKDSSLMSEGYSDSVVTSVSPTNSVSFLKQENSGYSKQLSSGLVVSSTFDDHIHHIDSITESPAQVWQSKGYSESNNSMIHMETKNSSSMWLPESRHTGFSLDAKTSANHLEPSQTLSGTNSKRSKPSFLDSINMPRVASSSTPPFVAGTTDSFSSRIHPEDSLPGFLNSKNSPVATGNGGSLLNNGVIENSLESKTDFYSRKQDEDFGALEQSLLVT